MRAGKLRKRITLQQRAAGSPQRTSTGQRDLTWSDLATLWASVEPLTGRRLEIAAASWPNVTVEVRIRYQTGLVGRQDLRVVFGAQIFPVAAVLNPELRNVELRLMCSEGAAVG